MRPNEKSFWFCPDKKYSADVELSSLTVFDLLNGFLTVLDTTNVSDDDLFDTQLDRFTATINAEKTLIVDSFFESTKLDFLAVVVRRRYQDDDDNGDQDSDSVDPFESCGGICDGWEYE